MHLWLLKWWWFKVGDSFFATHEVGDFNGENGGAISKWQIINGQLTRTESLSLQSVYPAHFVVDAEKNLAITANYGGGAVTVVAMDNGSLSHVVQVEFLTFSGQGISQSIKVNVTFLE